MNNFPPPQKKSGFSDSEVMSQVKKERGDSPKMSTLDILTKSAGGQIDPARLEAVLSETVRRNPKVRVIRANNSLFIIHNDGQGGADVIMETADKPKELVDSIKQFLQAMKAGNFKSLSFDVDNPDIIRVIKMGGYEPKLSSVGGQQMSAVVEL
jgi:hypothetical protein